MELPCLRAGESFAFGRWLVVRCKCGLRIINFTHANILPYAASFCLSIQFCFCFFMRLRCLSFMSTEVRVGWKG